MDTARHLVFIAASYAALAVIVGGLILWLAIDHRIQTRALAELEKRGMKRRSERG
jgi:heme exporter protein D